MIYTVNVGDAATKALRAIAKGDAERIRAKLRALAVDPRPPGAERMQGSDGELRIRVGDYRVIYEVNDAALVVLVITIGHRREVYR